MISKELVIIMADCKKWPFLNFFFLREKRESQRKTVGYPQGISCGAVMKAQVT